MIKRNFTGIGHHTTADMLRIIAFVGHPEKGPDYIDSTFGGMLGGILSFPDIFLDQDMRTWCSCADWNKPCNDPEKECKFRKSDGICNPPRFRFNVDCTIEPIRDEN